MFEGNIVSPWKIAFKFSFLPSWNRHETSQERPKYNGDHKHLFSTILFLEIKLDSLKRKHDLLTDCKHEFFDSAQRKPLSILWKHALEFRET